MKKDAVLDTLIPLPSYLLSPRARLLLGLHVVGSLLVGKLRTLASDSLFRLLLVCHYDSCCSPASSIEPYRLRLQPITG